MSELMEDGYPEDLTGLKFGKLEVMYKCELPKRNSYHCKCECGREIDFRRSKLIYRKSCGKCYHDSSVNGDSTTRIYSIYRHMLDRCYKLSDPAYKDYGGRGILVCDSWLDGYGSFKSDMYESYQKHVEEYGEKDTTLDRIDVNGNYCKENCRWLTNAEQQRNRRNNLLFTLNGSICSLIEYIENIDIKESTVRGRIASGMNIKDALTLPVKEHIKMIYKGVPLMQYCRDNNIAYKTVISRIYRGLDIESAVEIPIGVQYKTWIKMKENNEGLLDNQEKV